MLKSTGNFFLFAEVIVIFKTVGDLNDAVNVTSQNFVAVDIFLQHHLVVVLVDHFLLGCAKRESAASHVVDTGHEVVAGVGWVLLHFEGNI